MLERSGSLPGSSASDWAVDANSKKRYIALFNKFDSMRAGSLGGKDFPEKLNLSNCTHFGPWSYIEFKIVFLILFADMENEKYPPFL